MNSTQIAKLVETAGSLKKGQGLTVTAGGDVLVTNPAIKVHSLISGDLDIEHIMKLDSKRRRKSGSSQGRAFRRKLESTILKYKDLKPDEKTIVDLMSRMYLDICTQQPIEQRDSKYGKLKVYKVIDELKDTVFEVITTISGLILFINEPDKKMAHPIPSFLHKLRY